MNEQTETATQQIKMPRGIQLPAACPIITHATDDGPCSTTWPSQQVMVLHFARQHYLDKDHITTLCRHSELWERGVTVKQLDELVKR